MLEFSITNTAYFILLILICSTKMLKGKQHYDKIQWYSFQALLIITSIGLIYQLCDLISSL